MHDGLQLQLHLQLGWTCYVEHIIVRPCPSRLCLAYLHLDDRQLAIR